MKRFRRFTTRMLLAIVAITCIALAGSNYWLEAELKQYDREARLNNNDSSEFWRTANFDYEMGYVLPEWLLQFMDTETQEKFYRITELDFGCMKSSGSSVIKIRVALIFEIKP